MMKKSTKSEYGNTVYSFYMSKKQNLASIKGCNSATNFLKMTLYNYNLDLINVNVIWFNGLLLTAYLYVAIPLLLPHKKGTN